MANPNVAPTNAADLLRSGTAAGTWQLESGRSRVEFAVKHFWGLMTVRGVFEKFTGAATIDQSGNITGHLEADAQSLQTHHKKRDEHLRSADFFNAAADPLVTFTTKNVALAGDNRVHVTGELVAAGRTSDLEFDVALNNAAADHVDADAALTVDRTSFGMTWSPMHMTAADAKVNLHLHFTRSPAA
jgi:polyisoprenoid-binding protein YceI